MSIVHTVGRGVAWNTSSVLVGKVIIFANIFLILRHLSVYEYGLGELVLSVVATLGIFLLPGLSSAILADIAVERARGAYDKMKTLFLQFSLLSVLLGGIAWTVLFFGSDIAALFAGNTTVGYLLKIASFSLLIAPCRTISTMLASVELRYFDQSFYGIFEEAAKFIALVVFFFVLDLGLAGLLYAIVISQCVAVVLYIPRSLSAYRIFGAASAPEGYAFWQLVRAHRKWSIANSYVGNLGQTIQLWTIKLLLGTEAVGLFAFAQGIFSQVASFLPLGTVLGPLLPKYVDQRDAFARYVRSSMKVHVLLSVPLIAATAAGLPLLVAIFPKYEAAVPMILAIMWAIVPSAVIAVYTPAFAALKAQYSLFWSTVWKIAFICVFTPVAIMLFGLSGVGMSAVLILFASAIERTWRLEKVLPELSFGLKTLFSIDAHERALMRNVLAAWRSRLR